MQVRPSCVYDKISLVIPEIQLGPSTADQVMGDVQNDGHSASTGKDNNAAVRNQSSGSSEGRPWTEECTAEDLDRYPNLKSLVTTFTTFIMDKNVQVLEATMKELIPASGHTSVDHLVAHMHEKLLDDAMWDPSHDLRDFVDGVVSVLATEAREVAIQAQSVLL